MKFITYKEKQSSYGNVTLIEFSFCKWKESEKIKKIVNKIFSRQEDSLYFAGDVKEFLETYGEVFNCGIYNNLQTGIVDVFGINYYKKNCINDCMQKIKNNRLQGYEIVISWLEQALQYNGFYIVGI